MINQEVSWVPGAPSPPLTCLTMDDISGGVCTARLGPAFLLVLHLPPLSSVESLPYSLQLRLSTLSVCPLVRCVPPTTAFHSLSASLWRLRPLGSLPVSPHSVQLAEPFLSSLAPCDCLCTPHSTAGIPLSTSKLDPNHYLFSAHATSRPLCGPSCCRNASPCGILSELTTWKHNQPMWSLLSAQGKHAMGWAGALPEAHSRPTRGRSKWDIRIPGFYPHFTPCIVWLWGFRFLIDKRREWNLELLRLYV